MLCPRACSSAQGDEGNPSSPCAFSGGKATPTPSLLQLSSEPRRLRLLLKEIEGNFKQSRVCGAGWWIM